MSDDVNPTEHPTRHPELMAWLLERQNTFPSWADQAGGAALFDFTPASLDVLDTLIRETASGLDQLTEQRRTPFVQGAVWYVGEMMCRTHGMVWRYTPEPLDEGGYPPLFDPADTPALDTPSVAFPDAGPDEAFYPLNILCRILEDEDSSGMPIDERLVDVLDPAYLKDDEDDDEDDDDDEL
jgi:hypothetical protein